MCCTQLSIQLHCNNMVEGDLQLIFLIHATLKCRYICFHPTSWLTPACSKPDRNYAHSYKFSFWWRTYVEFGSWCSLKKPTVIYSHVRFWRMCNFQFYIIILSSNLPPTQCSSCSCWNIWSLDNQKMYWIINCEVALQPRTLSLNSRYQRCFTSNKHRMHCNGFGDLSPLLVSRRYPAALSKLQIFETKLHKMCFLFEPYWWDLQD